jgi:hypothetical protein
MQPGSTAAAAMAMALLAMNLLLDVFMMKGFPGK